MANQPDTLQVSQSSRLRNHFIKGAMGSLVLQVGFAGFAFLNTIILARVLGATGYGTFANSMAWVNLLTIPATFGFGILLVRDAAIYKSQAKWGLLKGLLRFSNRIVLALSIVLSLIAAAFAGWLYESSVQTIMRHTLWIALLLLPLFALYNLREATTRGLEHVIRARFPGMIVRPGLLLLGIVSIYYFYPNQLSVQVSMAINVGAGVVALVLGVFFLRGVLPRQVKVATAHYTPRPWLKAAFPMLVYGGAQIILGRTDVVMLGAMRGAYEVGLYAVANRLAFLLIYFTVAMELIVAPIMSRFYAKGEKVRLQLIINKAVHLSFVMAFTLGAIFIIFGDQILVIFGHTFILARSALLILVVGKLISISLGSGSLMLAMTGYEKILSFIIISISLVNILLNALLIPKFGINGAAFATSISQVSCQIVLSVYALIKTGINVSVFGVYYLKKGERYEIV